MWQLDGIREYVKSDRFKERPINWYPEAKWYWKMYKKVNDNWCLHNLNVKQYIQTELNEL